MIQKPTETREEILSRAAISANEKTFAPGFTVRRISPREEFILDKINSPLIDYAAIISGKNINLKHADLQRALFICTADFDTVLRAIDAGTFESAFFDFLKKIPSREIEAQAFAYLISDAQAVAAAEFESAEKQSETKNARSRAA